MKRLITFSVFLILLLMLMSCGSGYHLRKANKHIQKAESKGAKWSYDTTFHITQIRVPPVQVEFTPKKLILNDTLFFEKKNIITKVVIRHDSVFVETKCPEVVIEKKVPVTVVKTIEAKQSLRWWHVVEAFFIAFCVGYLVRMLWTK